MRKLRHKESWYSRTKKELEEMDYKEKYEKALEWMKSIYPTMQGSDKEDAEHYFPELTESEDERIKKIITDSVFFQYGAGVEYKDVLDYLDKLEKQKEANKAIEAVDRIDKYIDEHLANAHDMKDSNPEKKYYRGWDDALGKMAGILQDVYSDGKQKEQKRYWKPTETDVALFNKAVTTNKALAPAERAQLDIIRSKFGCCRATNCSGIVQKERKNFRKLYEDIAQSEWFKQSYVGKSLGEEENPKEWSEEDERMSEGFMHKLEVCDLLTNKEIAWAKHRLNSLHPQPRQEWDEFDEDCLKRAIWYVENPAPSVVKDTNLALWLKSLRPSWKPTEEQMEALERAANKFAKTDVADSVRLSIMYDNLKKWM